MNCNNSLVIFKASTMHSGLWHRKLGQKILFRMLRYNVRNTEILLLEKNRGKERTTHIR